MRNVTICLSDETHRRARIVAAEHGVSLSFLVASILDSLPSVRRLQERIEHRKQSFARASGR